MSNSSRSGANSRFIDVINQIPLSTYRRGCGRCLLRHGSASDIGCGGIVLHCAPSGALTECGQHGDGLSVRGWVRLS